MNNIESYKSSAYFEEFEGQNESFKDSFRQSYFDPPLIESVVSSSILGNDSLLNPNMMQVKSGVNNKQMTML